MLLDGAPKRQITLTHAQPGNPQKNAYVQRYNCTVHYDWLTQYFFSSLEEVQQAPIEGLWTYNHERPNMALGVITSIQKLPTPSTEKLKMGKLPNNYRVV